MATCPNCGQALDTVHRCTGLWRLRLRVFRTVAIGGMVGALIGSGLALVLYGGVSGVPIVAAAAVGALVVHAAMRGESL